MSEPDSELRIALVAEGPTDYHIIEAALKAILPNPFVMVRWHPEPTQPKPIQPNLGAGWCGIAKWCNQAHQRHQGLLIDDPTLVNFDLVIIHIDVDVAHKKYADYGASGEVLVQENAWENLPCAQTCPPISDTVDALITVVQSWLGRVEAGDRTVFCLPAQSSGTWLAAAVLPPTHPLLVDAECNSTLESQLKGLPKEQRIKKKKQYRNLAPQITKQWPQLKQLCTQAEEFETLVLAAIFGHS